MDPSHYSVPRTIFHERALMTFARPMLARAGAASTVCLVVLAGSPASPAFAATYTVYWNTSSSPYAYGYAYTDVNCKSGAKLLDNSHTSANGRRSIKSSAITDFTWGGTRPTTVRIAYNKCYRLPDSGLWYGYDPAR